MQVDPQARLTAIVELEIQSWNYVSEASVQGKLMSEPQTEQPTTSFVVRLWQEWSLNAPWWWGRVVHLQSGETVAFQDWE